MVKFFLGGLGNWFNDYKLIEPLILEADHLGWDGALLPDHYMWGTSDFIKRPDSNVTLETWITLTHLLAKTEQIHLGTLVTPIPFRPPGLLAKMISTADILSNGRVIVGIGAGWSQVEFDGYSEWNTPGVRVAKTREGLELMIQLWTQEEVTFKGKYYTAKGAILEPKPIQKPYPKLLFGGRGNKMLKLAGQYADICFVPPFRPGVQSADREKQKETVRQAAKNRTNKLAFMEGSMGSQISRLPYNSKEYTKLVEQAVESGTKYFLASFPRNEEVLDILKRFSNEVIPSFK
ncbi:MAG: LLM class flavin-dependent oxidoreductase [Candidatus Hodarchaeota archaeon]